MGLLIDTDLRLRAAAGPGQLISGIDPTNLATHIRGCAVDMHIGEMYRPGVDSGKPGAAGSPNRLPLTLNEGETALIQSLESFNLDAEHAAFVFPASSVSIQGLLMTNPGHVDPGYAGPVHVTVINMGREPFSLQPGTRFLRSFVYKLDSPVASPKAPGVAPAVTQELLNKLSPDFLSVNQRTAAAAKKEMDAAVKRSHFLQFGFPAIATVLAAALAATLSNCSIKDRFEDRIKSLEEAKAVERLRTLELNYPTEKRLLDIETRLKSMPPEQRGQTSGTRTKK